MPFLHSSRRVPVTKLCSSNCLGCAVAPLPASRVAQQWLRTAPSTKRPNSGLWHRPSPPWRYHPSSRGLHCAYGCSSVRGTEQNEPSLAAPHERGIQSCEKIRKSCFLLACALKRSREGSTHPRHPRSLLLRLRFQPALVLLRQMPHMVSRPLEPGGSRLPVPRAEGMGKLLGLPCLPGEPKSIWLYPPGVLSPGRVRLSHGPAAWELVLLPSTGRLSPSRPFGHTGTWSSAWLEVWSAWLSLFARRCGLSSSRRGWRDTLRPAAAVGCVSRLG